MAWLKRNWFRIVLLVVSAFLAAVAGRDIDWGNEGVTHFLRDQGNAILPRLSPLLNLFGALGAREWMGWSLLLGLPLVFLALVKGRVFCWRMCPMGFLAELAGKLNPWGKTNVRRVPAINKALALIIVVTAACGYPLLIWLDPLCIFNGFFAVWREPLAWASSVTGIGFVTVLLIGVIAPNAWCHKICPLGGFQQALMDFSKRVRTPKKGDASKDAAPSAPTVMENAPQVARRVVLAAIPAAAAGLLAKKVCGPQGAKAIRPPSADVARINALCARCGNCMKACPYQLIQPDLGSTGVDGLFTPVIRFRSQNEAQEQFCFQDCTVCTQVCPTGALHPITVEEKHEVRLGIAVIDRTKCVAWAKNEHCVVCDEFCPYKAVITVKRNGVPYPTVDATKCRGCGACESACAADPVAIVVKPLPR